MNVVKTECNESLSNGMQAKHSETAVNEVMLSEWGVSEPNGDGWKAEATEPMEAEWL